MPYPASNASFPWDPDSSLDDLAPIKSGERLYITANNTRLCTKPPDSVDSKNSRINNILDAFPRGQHKTTGHHQCVHLQFFNRMLHFPPRGKGDITTLVFAGDRS